MNMLFQKCTFTKAHTEKGRKKANRPEEGKEYYRAGEIA
jgi:hypothetical protein